jgi:hypothetical protein
MLGIVIGAVAGEQAPARLDVALEHGPERGAAVEAVDEERRIRVRGPAHPPPVDEPAVVVGRRLRPDTADDAQRALRHGSAILALASLPVCFPVAWPRSD